MRKGVELLKRLRALVVLVGAGSATRGLDQGAHGAFGLRHSRVGSVGMDLIAAEFGFGESAGDHDRTPGGVDLDGVLEGSEAE